MARLAASYPVVNISSMEITGRRLRVDGTSAGIFQLADAAFGDEQRYTEQRQAAAVVIVTVRLPHQLRFTAAMGDSTSDVAPFLDR